MRCGTLRAPGTDDVMPLNYVRCAEHAHINREDW
jgi:hypothetical protein